MVLFDCIFLIQDRKTFIRSALIISAGHAPATADSDVLETPAGRGGMKEPPQIMVTFRPLQKASLLSFLQRASYVRVNVAAPVGVLTRREILYLYICIPAMFSPCPVQLA